jgi:8-oxo-dGTP diphosphatase
VRTLADVDWTTWAARDTAVLLFVVRGERVLLIRKKRGLGAGKINGPGGRVDPGETPLQAALRELSEEVRLSAATATFHGELRFQFVDGYSIHVHVFRSEEAPGDPAETEEAVPLWFAIDQIPFDEMWADDRLWLPHVLAGGTVSGDFVFDGDRMVDHRLDLL